MTKRRVAVVTLAHGRHSHLAAQLRALAGSSTLPDLYVVAAMDDPGIEQVVHEVADVTRPAHRTRVVSVPRGRRGLPLARARNVAARVAVDSGIEVLVFLDVDCLPSAQLVSRYAEVVAAAAGLPVPTVYSGAVHYLPPPSGDAGSYSPSDLQASSPHPARPVPEPDQVVQAEDPLLFWSLSFAMSAQDWLLVGGFDEEYEGYGGEDTDYAMRLSAQQGRLCWVGGAPSYHQYHDVEDPPVGHVADIVRNGNRFRGRWGFFPMQGWLSAFAERGLIQLSQQTGSVPIWHLTQAGRTAARTWSPSGPVRGTARRTPAPTVGPG